MTTAPSRRNLRIRTLMALIGLAAILAWFVAVPWPRLHAWWPDRHLYASLDRRVPLPLPPDPTLEDVLKGLRAASPTPSLPGGVPVYVDPAALTAAGRSPTSPVTAPPPGRSLGQSLEATLRPLGLGYEVKGGLLRVIEAGIRP